MPEPDAEFAVTPVVLSRYVEPASQFAASSRLTIRDVFVHGQARRFVRRRDGSFKRRIT